MLERSPKPGYYYEHTNGTIHWKPFNVVDMGGGPGVYFDSPFVHRWWKVEPASHEEGAEQRLQLGAASDPVRDIGSALMQIEAEAEALESAGGPYLRGKRDALRWALGRINDAVGSAPRLTAKARFCNQAGPMGGGCADSWHVGGNHGSHVCRNPDHHDAPGAE